MLWRKITLIWYKEGKSGRDAALAGVIPEPSRWWGDKNMDSVLPDTKYIIQTPILPPWRPVSSFSLFHCLPRPRAPKRVKGGADQGETTCYIVLAYFNKGRQSVRFHTENLWEIGNQCNNEQGTQKYRWAFQGNKTISLQSNTEQGNKEGEQPLSNVFSVHRYY